MNLRFTLALLMVVVTGLTGCDQSGVAGRAAPSDGAAGDADGDATTAANGGAGPGVDLTPVCEIGTSSGGEKVSGRFSCPPQG